MATEPTTESLIEQAHRGALHAITLGIADHARLLTALADRLAAVADLEAVLRQAEKALLKNVTTWIALEHHLDTPYPDDPRWTPWTRFGHRAMSRSGDALTEVRAALRALAAAVAGEAGVGG